jgi:hypothetical protein
MKKILSLLFAGACVCALCGAYTSCNEPKKSESPDGSNATNILPASNSDLPASVSAFFVKAMPQISGTYSEYFFIDDKNNKCLTINSLNELKAILPPSAELPEIDFDKYTLIIGQHIVGGTGHTLNLQNINIEPDKTTINLVVKKPEAMYTIMSPLYYWGVYPKFSGINIVVNITLIDK